MKTFHFFVQAKGGSGKSFLTYLYALKHQQDKETFFVDVDNSTQTSAKQLQFLLAEKRIAKISLFDKKEKQDRTLLFTVLMQLASHEFQQFFLDFGAPESEQLPALVRKDFSVAQLGRLAKHINAEFIFHCIIAGNTAFSPCMEYLATIATLLHTSFKIIVHVNESTFMGIETRPQEELLQKFCQKHNFELKYFGNFDTESIVGKQIVYNVQTGLGLDEFGFGELLKMEIELEKL